MRENMIQIDTSHVDLEDSAIAEDWIIAGKPVARCKRLSGSADGTSSTWIWDCTAGRFIWNYRIDETAYIIEGSMVIKDQTGRSRTVKAGDTIYFPAGSSAEWTVERYVRKVAFLRAPVPRILMGPYRALRLGKRWAIAAGSLFTRSPGRPDDADAAINRTGTPGADSTASFDL